MLRHVVLTCSREEATRTLILLSQPSQLSTDDDTNVNSDKLIHTLFRSPDTTRYSRHQNIRMKNGLTRHYTCSLSGCRAHFTVCNVDHTNVAITVIRYHDFQNPQLYESNMSMYETPRRAKGRVNVDVEGITPFYQKSSSVSLLSKPVGHMFKTFSFTSAQMRFIVRHFSTKGNQETTPAQWHKLIGPSPSVPNLLRKLFRSNTKFHIRKYLERMFNVHVFI